MGRVSYAMSRVSLMLYFGHVVGIYIIFGSVLLRDPGMKHPQQKHIIPFRVPSTMSMRTNCPK